MDNNIKPKISVMICTYNRAKYISQAIQSVLDQTMKGFEIILIDDGSTDNTKEIVGHIKDPRIKYFLNKNNIGITKSRNKALSLSSGEFIAVLDSDDYWTDNSKLEKQMLFLENNPSFSLVGTHSRIVDEREFEVGEIVNETEDLSIRKQILLKNQFTHSSVLYRKSSLPYLYNESLFIWEDYYAWLEIGKKFKFANLPIFTTAHRKHASNISRNKKIKGTVAMQKILNRFKNDYPHFCTATIKNILRLFK